MSRKELSDNDKKPKISITINTELLLLLEEYIKDMNVNRSKYIESLIIKDIIKRGFEIKKKFER